jgi:hypothetical protein
VAQIAGEEHGRHAAATELALDGVGGERALQRAAQIGQCTSVL